MGYPKKKSSTCSHNEMFVTWCIWLSLIGSFIEWYTYNDNLDCLRLVVKDPFTALDKTGALVSIWPNVFNHVKFSRESCETFDVKNKSACFKAFISRSTTNLTHLTNPALAALLLRIRFLKQVKYLDSLRFNTAFSTKDDFLWLSDLEEDTEDLVELFNCFFRGEQEWRLESDLAVWGWSLSWSLPLPLP